MSIYRNFTLEEIRQHFVCNDIIERPDVFVLKPGGLCDGQEYFTIPKSLPLLMEGLPYDITMPICSEYTEEALTRLGLLDALENYDYVHVRFGNFETADNDENKHDIFHLVDPRQSSHAQVLAFSSRLSHHTGLMSHVYAKKQDAFEHALKVFYVTSHDIGLDVLDLIVPCPLSAYDLRISLAKYLGYS